MTAVGLLAAVSLLMTGTAGADSGTGAAPPPAVTVSGEPAAAVGGTGPAPDADADGEIIAAQQADLTGDIVFSESSRTFRGQISVSLSTTVSDAEIRYTTDGRLPTASSPVYTGPLEFRTTTQLRARAFVGGAPSGDPGTALYTARSFDATHDLPVMVMDAYGGGKPGREYRDVSTMVMEPQGGTASLSATPTVATRAGFRLRGQSSAEFEKAPYRLELWDNDNDDAAYPMLGMPAEADWVLRGPFSDKALIRDAFVYSLGRDMGMETPRFAFFELYLNLDSQPVSPDDYQGVYMLVETIKDGPDRIDIEKLRKSDTTLPEISGGYIFKFEWFAAEEPILHCPGGGWDCWRDLEIKRPKSPNSQQMQWLGQHLKEFHDALRGPDPSHPQTGYPAYIDVGSFVDQIIIAELSRDMDAYIRSSYFHKDRNEKIVAGPLWDYDLTFGTGGFFNNTEIRGWQFQEVRQPVANDWFVRLMDDPSFVQRVDTRWRQLRQGILSDQQINARINSLASPLTNGAQRNFQKWPNLTQPMIGFFFTPTAPTWQGQVDFMRDWTHRRAAWLDSSGWRPNAGFAVAPDRQLP
ncbi:hypothetical protein GCM10009716_18500 [Streptomyces sodiiphilus]|uniref:GH29D-like beta-sandwich domain-containing protein n=2 Tax=Streptomyces sodiiphilus TaxID=226217 RepID=A0ABN2P0W4_9ACTN